jgi:4-hydroxy-tetrahydrodipicolinate reductase
VYANVGEALDGVDVLAEFTSHTHAKQIALAAIERGVAVVIGSSGLTADDFQEVDEAARAAGVGAVAAGRGSR